ncbi:MAG: hypothetical protein AB1801_01735 [Chloroflexota bacterium]
MSTEQAAAARWISPRAGLLLAVVLSVFVVAPLFYPGYIQTHAGYIPLWNVIDLRANLGRWSWLPHIATRFDPLRGDGLLPYYLAAVLPLEPGAAVKMVLGLSWLLGSAGMFLWLKSWLGQPGALLAALVYTYLPYHIVTVYVRGAWGEALFWGLLPWALLSAAFLAAAPQSRRLPAAAGFWLLLGLSQLGLTLWAFAFVAMLALSLHRRRSFGPILAALGGTALAVDFSLAWPPVPAPINFTGHFLYPAQLFSAYWGFGVSRPGWHDGLSLQLGLAATGLALISIIVWQAHQPPDSPAGRLERRLIFFLAVAGSLILLQLGLAAFVWRVPLGPGLSLASTLTYPWQLLGLTGLCLAILAGAGFWLDPRLSDWPLFGAAVLLVILSSYNYLSPQFTRTAPPAGRPPAGWGDHQLALLDHRFTVMTSGNTAGLTRRATAIPVALSGPPHPNDSLRLDVVWQPLQPFNQNLKVFVHLVDSTGRVLAQYDGYPQAGTYPTVDWIPGELIEDSYPLLLPADAPAGPYRVYLGLYDETTLSRLPVLTDAEGRVILNVE